ncbi:MAG: type IV pilus assembly protein PilM [Patescibacteria group bacterium]
MLINPFKNAFGLDFGDRSVKLVQLSKRGVGLGKKRYKLNHASGFDLPPGLIVDGEIQRPEEVLRLLRHHLTSRHKGLEKSPWVVTSLPETKTYVQLIKVKVDLEEGEKIDPQDVIDQVPSYLPFDLESVYLDWQPVDCEEVCGKERSVLLAAVPKTIADSYTYLLNMAGLSPLSMEVEATAIARAVINRGKSLKGEARGILDLGAARSSFIIYDHGVVQFSLSLPVSGQKITESISRSLKIDPVEAEKIKRECGLESKKCQGKTKKVLTETLDDLTDKIFQAINFYKLHFPDKNPLTVIRTTGGGANMPALESYLSSKLKIKVRKANPWVNLFPVDKPPMPPEESLRYATSIGLAMRALEDPILL